MPERMIEEVGGRATLSELRAYDRDVAWLDERGELDVRARYWASLKLPGGESVVAGGSSSAEAVARVRRQVEAREAGGEEEVEDEGAGDGSEAEA